MFVHVFIYLKWVQAYFIDPFINQLWDPTLIHTQKTY